MYNTITPELTVIPTVSSSILIFVVIPLAVTIPLVLLIVIIAVFLIVCFMKRRAKMENNKADLVLNVIPPKPLLRK